MRKLKKEAKDKMIALDRFLRHVNKTNTCWLWTACKNKAGYGNVGVDRKIKLAHRVAHELFIGPIPKDLCVCHKCDNTSCVNPSHLFTGTQNDNNQDCIQKGRASDPRNCSHKGEKNSHAILTANNVKEIRQLYSTGRFLQKDLAKRFAVSKSRISYITTKKQWTHIK